MKCKVIAFLLCIIFVCTLCLPVYADSDSSSNDGYSAIISDIPKVCPTCGSALHAFWFSTAGAEVELSISDEGKVTIPAGAGVFATINLKCKSCGYEKAETRLFGLDWGNEKPGQWEVKEAPSGIGRKDLPGYSDDNGTPYVTSSGKLSIQMQLNGFDTSYGYNHVIKTSRSSECFTSQVSDAGSFSGTGNTLTVTNNVKRKNGGLAAISFYLIAPCDGYYTITNQSFDFSYTQRASNGDYYSELEGSAASYVGIIVDDNCCFINSNSNYTGTKSLSITRTLSNTVRATKGQIIGVSACGRLPYNDYAVQSTLKISCDIPVLTCEPDAITINQESTITINNNTWNGNIYTDSSTNLTYIYPQYTTINEKNETVTNISNTPIIYNNETKQYYTYDQTTKNYYYITYNSDPAPSPTPTPAPTDKPGGSISTPETGKPGGSSGSSWWDKLLDKLGNAVIDGLLGAVSAVLKLIFKLLSTILGWIIWAVSLVFTLFPFLPPGLSGLLVGGVVVCFVIGIIKFIRG